MDAQAAVFPPSCVEVPTQKLIISREFFTELLPWLLASTRTATPVAGVPVVPQSAKLAAPSMLIVEEPRKAPLTKLTFPSCCTAKPATTTRTTVRATIPNLGARPCEGTAFGHLGVLIPENRSNMLIRIYDSLKRGVPQASGYLDQTTTQIPIVYKGLTPTVNSAGGLNSQWHLPDSFS